VVKITVQQTDRYFVVSFPYNRDIVEEIKEIPGRKYDAPTKSWKVPLAQVKALQRIVAKWESPIVAEERIPIVEQDASTVYPTCSRNRPWGHQLKTLRTIWNMESALIDGIMGCGKSKIIVDYVLNKPDIHKVLIVCPLSVVPVWTRQFAVHGGKPVEICELDRGTIRERAAVIPVVLEEAKRKNRIAIIVVNYEAIWREPLEDAMFDAKFDLLVGDEIHRAKAPGGVISRCLARLSKKIPLRFGMSGTLLPHSPLDAYGVCRAVGSPIFGTSFHRFRATYAVMGGFNNQQVFQWINQDDLRQKLNTIRVLIEPEGYDLPEAVHSDIVVELPVSARRLYDKLAKELFIQLETGSLSVANAAVLLTRLQAVASGFLPIDDNNGMRIMQDVHDAKHNALRDLLEDLGRVPLVIFCRFRYDLRTIANTIKTMGYTSSELSGAVKDVEKWQKGESDILVAQLRAGSVGVDLTRAARVIYWNYDFSLESYSQSMARINRPGQKSTTVWYHHILANNTVDMRIRDALDKRRDILEELLEVRL